MSSKDTLLAQRYAAEAKIAAATAKVYSQGNSELTDEIAASLTEAEASATSAANYASLAEQYYDYSTSLSSFFIGALSIAPSTRSDGSAVEVGDMYKNTTDEVVYSYNSDGSWSSLTYDEAKTEELYSIGVEMYSVGQEYYDFVVAQSELAVTEIGNYEDGILTLTSEHQEIRRDGIKYYLASGISLPYTTTGTTDTTWEADKGNFVTVGDVVLREELSSSDGLKLIGKVESLGALRNVEPLKANQQILVSGYRSGSTTGFGTFYYHQSDTTSIDNDCTVVVTSNGARWKRMFASGNVNTDWAGVLSTDETTDAQDDAFDNCIAAAKNSSGYVTRKIFVPENKRVYLSEKHYLRGGSFTYDDAQGSSTYRNTQLGISGTFAVGSGAGFFVVQAQAPDFNLRIDNAGVTLTSPSITDYVDDDSVLQFEQLVWNPSIKIDANEYTGTLIKSLGKGSDSVTQTSAYWSDLTTQRHGMYLLAGNVHITANGCGRVWNIQNCPSGFGNFGQVWEQASASDNLMNAVSDLAFPYYENTISYSSTSMGRCIYRSMGTCHFGKMLVGPHGNPAVHFEGSYQVTIDKFFAVIGSSTYPTISFYGMDIVSSNVTFGKVYSQGHYGSVFRILKGSQVIALGLNGDDLRQIAILTNDATNYAPLTTGTYTGTYPKMTVASGYIRRANSKSLISGESLSPLPLFYIESTVTAGGGLCLRDFTPREAYGSYTDETDKYYIKCLSSAAGLIDIDGMDLSQSNYPLYLTDPANLKRFNGISQISGGCKIRYVNGTTASEIGGKEVLSSSTTTPVIGTTYTNSNERALRYSFRIVVSSGGSVTVSKNGTEYIVQNYVGTQRINIILNKGEYFLISSTDTSLVSVGAANIYWSL